MSLRPLLLAADQGACAYYRVREPGRVAIASGIDATVKDDGLPVDATQTPDGEITIHDITDEWNLIVFQRPTLRVLVKAIQFAQAKGIACAVELDDDLTKVHKDNVAYNAYNGATPEHWQNTVEAARLADIVITTTPALAKRFAPHGRAAVIPNYIAEANLQPAKSFRSDAAFGWTGTIQTHPEDLDVAGAHIGTVVNSKQPSQFSVVGDGAGISQKLYLNDSVYRTNTGWLDYSNYLRSIRDSIDIGVVPLKLDDFNAAKSWLKGLEYSSQGVPFVASPTEAYQSLYAHGAGLLANKPRDWQKHLKRLSTDAAYYNDQAAACSAAAAELTYEKHAQEWVDAWTQAVEHRNSCS